jgi:hypothetical protein
MRCAGKAHDLSGGCGPTVCSHDGRHRGLQAEPPDLPRKLGCRDVLPLVGIKHRAEIRIADFPAVPFRCVRLPQRRSRRRDRQSGDQLTVLSAQYAFTRPRTKTDVLPSAYSYRLGRMPCDDLIRVGGGSGLMGSASPGPHPTRRTPLA